MAGSALRDSDVALITRLPFDFDPVRPAGVCSTAAELELAFGRRNALAATLRSLGWPLPLHAKSGNGYHAVYRCRLPCSTETKQMLDPIYRGQHRELDDDVVSFDRTVRNPGRIFRLYGTVNRKGPNTPERPHRRSACWIPNPWNKVDQRLIERLADRYARDAISVGAGSSESRSDRPAVAGNGDYRTLDIVAWFSSHGLYRRPIDGDKHSVYCPWRAEHSTPHGDTGAVIFEADGGWPGFYCHHAHCAGRTIRAVMDLLGDADCFCSARFPGKANG